MPKIFIDFFFARAWEERALVDLLCCCWMKGTRSGFAFLPATATVRPVEAEPELRIAPELRTLCWSSKTIKDAVELLWSMSSSSMVVTTTLLDPALLAPELEVVRQELPAPPRSLERLRAAWIRMAKVTMIMTMRTPATTPRTVSIKGSSSIECASPPGIIKPYVLQFPLGYSSPYIVFEKTARVNSKRDLIRVPKWNFLARPLRRKCTFWCCWHLAIPCW